MKIYIFLVAAAFLSSCQSYFTRKSCESTNWFDYGMKVALEGRRLTGDQWVNECYKADADVAESDLDRGFKAGMAKYCLPATVYQIGKDGNFFSEEMCVGNGLSNLRALHQKGVLEYCDKANGYAAGAKGKEYNKICPGELEKAFLPEFNRGRRKYLSTVLTQNQNEIRDLENQSARLQNELNYKRGVLIGLQARFTPTKPKEVNPQISRMQNEVNSTEYSLQSVNGKINKLKEQNKKIEIEIVQLGS